MLILMSFDEIELDIDDELTKTTCTAVQIRFVLHIVEMYIGTFEEMDMFDYCVSSDSYDCRNRLTCILKSFSNIMTVP